MIPNKMENSISEFYDQILFDTMIDYEYIFKSLHCLSNGKVQQYLT